MKFQKLCLAGGLFVTMIAISPTFAAVCSTAELNGVWGYQVGAAVGQFTANSQGSLSGSQTVIENGIVLTQTYTGTYSVARNCTGSLTINFAGGGTSRVNFVLFNGKKGVQ